MPREVKRPVIFTGENPGLSLYRPGTDELVVAASYWRCTYSAHGEGNVLVLWLDQAALEAGEGTLTVIYADNAPLARFVTDTLNQHFGDFQNRGFADVQPEPARFSQEWGSRGSHRVAVQAAERRVELVWRDVRDYGQVVATAMALGGRSFDLATVICPCATGTITVDDVAVAGEVRLGERDGRPQSSAFLAFAESWVENGPAEA